MQTDSKMADELLTLKEVCAYLKVSMASAAVWVRTGDIPAVKVGREWRVRRADLDGWLEARKVGAA